MNKDCREFGGVMLGKLKSVCIGNVMKLVKLVKNLVNCCNLPNLSKFSLLSLNTAMPLKLFWYIDNLFRIHMKFTELIYRNYWTRKVPDCILCRYARLSQAQPDTRGWTAFWGEFFVKMVFTPGKTLTSTSRPYTSCVH